MKGIVNNVMVVRMLAAVLMAASVAGCSAMMTAEEPVKPAITVDDVLAMSDAGIKPSIIIRKIEITKSDFSLSTDDIIRLKEKGVDDDVVTVMLGANDEAREADREMGRAYYEKSINFYITHYPSFLPFDRYYPIMNYSYGPFPGMRYQWSGVEGAYYRDFPVGLPRLYRGRASVPAIRRDGKSGGSDDSASGNDK